MLAIKFIAKRIDNDQFVEGNYFVAPLTDENSGMESSAGMFFLAGGEKKHCIEVNGVAYVIDPTTLRWETKANSDLHEQPDLTGRFMLRRVNENQEPYFVYVTRYSKNFETWVCKILNSGGIVFSHAKDLLPMDIVEYNKMYGKYLYKKGKNTIKNAKKYMNEPDKQ